MLHPLDMVNSAAEPACVQCWAHTTTPCTANVVRPPLERTEQVKVFSFCKWVLKLQVRCLNEAVEGSARGVFRAWDQRLDDTGNPLESNEDDPELLLHIPFDGAVKLKAICIIGESALPGLLPCMYQWSQTTGSLAASHTFSHIDCATSGQVATVACEARHGCGSPKRLYAIAVSL